MSGRKTLPGVARVRITGDDAATQALLDALAEHFTVTDPDPYSGGRSYLEVDTRPGSAPSGAGPGDDGPDMPRASKHRPAEVPSTVAVMMARQINAAHLHLSQFRNLVQTYGDGLVPEWPKPGQAPDNPVDQTLSMASRLLYELREWSSHTAHASGAVSVLPEIIAASEEQLRAEAVLYPPGGWCALPGGTMPPPGEEREAESAADPIVAQLLGPVPEKRYSARASGRSVQRALPAVADTPAAAVWTAERVLHGYVCQHWERPGDTPADLAAAVDGLDELADTFTSACTHVLGEIRRRMDEGLLVDIDEDAFTESAAAVRAQLGIEPERVPKLAYALSRVRQAMAGARAALPAAVGGARAFDALEQTRALGALDGKSLPEVRHRLGGERHWQRHRSKTRVPDYTATDWLRRAMHWMHAAGVNAYDHGAHLAAERHPERSGLPIGPPAIIEDGGAR
ncbi:hypothetical protein K388_07169 [Streptomyces sp. KhCrAH-43]|uniref:hypothetical protein n=1 Tax=unclassified Streptomyces TaxID=2593676 RepID=UPI0003795139|nr:MULTISPECIES: hypothetical protein [unclassified Streptomyces]MYS36371.1 hypothetical protein [Streptomyces sp. SID4920]MYX63934.1 hypothetical protein [Streptomyces sp. SID8373]RAJ47788.1 hypothetical protein K388_07169 [Streptomyces sp. KhCrAH-43]